jgi:hypothetical protein
MAQEKFVARYRTAVSVFIIAVLAAQAATIPVTAMHGAFLRSKLYPILEYPMYAPAHYNGERVTASWLIEGVVPDGKTIGITNDQLHVDIFDFINIVQSALQGNSREIDTLRELVRDRVPGADRIQELRIKNYPLKVTRDGPQPLPSEVVMTIPVQPAPVSTR